MIWVAGIWIIIVGALGATHTKITNLESILTTVESYWSNSNQTVYDAESTYTIVQTAAAKFKQVECPAITSQPFCATAIPALRTANTNAITALRAAETFVRANPTLDASNLIQTAENAIQAVAALETQYGIMTSTGEN